MSANNLDLSLSRIASELKESEMPSESAFVEQVRRRISEGEFNAMYVHDQNDLRVLVQFLVSPRGYIEATGGRLPMNLWANLLSDTAIQLKAEYPGIAM